MKVNIICYITFDEQKKDVSNYITVHYMFQNCYSIYTSEVFGTETT